MHNITFSHMFNPKLAPLRSNLPQITHNKDPFSLPKVLPQPNTSLVLFRQVREVIINTLILPIEITLEEAEGKENVLLVTATTISNKDKVKNCSIPLQAERHKWLKIVFGCEFRKVQVRSKFNENKIGKNSIYCSTSAWLNDHRQDLQSILQCTVTSLITSRHSQTSQHRSRGQLGTLVRAKFSERANSFSHKESMIGRKNIDQTIIHMGSRAESDANGLPSGKKYDSACLNFNAKNREKISQRTSNTSNSLRGGSQESRFSKKLQKATEVQDCNTCYKPVVFFEEPSQFVPLQGRHRLRFYQQIPFSHEQIELKRKKFDSQFIGKADDSPQLNSVKTNESEVTEDIIKCENSRVGLALDDTLERGLEQNREGKAGGEVQESGTLCESVFQ